MAIAVAFASGRLGPLDRVAPLVVLSGLAVVVAAGDKVLLYRERLVSSAWLGLLVAPPVLGRGRSGDFSVDVRHRSQNRAAGKCRGALLCRHLPAPHRQAARLCERRSAGRATGRARRAKPAARLFRLGAAAQPVGKPGRYPCARRHSGLAGGRQQRHAARDTEGAISRNGAGSAALVPACSARHVAAHPAWLVDAAAADAL